MTAPIDQHGPTIIVGAHPGAEAAHRPLAYRLQSMPIWPSTPGVLTDVWTLNHTEFRERPFVAIGAPEFNAVTAAFADRLPSVWAVDGRQLVQMDTQGPVPAVLCWGADADQTAGALDVFIERHLAVFIEALAARA